MCLINSKTIKRSVSFNGIALHSGKNVNLKIQPTDVDWQEYSRG